MDAVITYVNMNDPEWIKSYRETFNDTPNIKRYKELGTLELQIKCIRKYMPWIDNIYVVVCSHSQVKDLKDTVVITHDQIIPEKYLPTFNSCTIEMFLHNIPNLSEYFIYFNDDMIPINYLDEKDFFDDKPVLSFKTTSEIPYNIYRHQCKNSSNLARVLAGLNPSSTYSKTDHICSVHKKSVYEYIWSKAGKTIDSSISKKREQKNFNQYLFSDYLLYTNQCKIKKLDYEYITYSSIKPQYLYDTIVNQTHHLICIQDNVDDNAYNEWLIKGLTDLLKKNE